MLICLNQHSYKESEIHPYRQKNSFSDFLLSTDLLINFQIEIVCQVFHNSVYSACCSILAADELYHSAPVERSQ